MSKARNAAGLRRLAGLFTNDVSSTINTSSSGQKMRKATEAKVLCLSSSTNASRIAVAPASVISSKFTAEVRKLKELVKKFKKSCEFSKFRQNNRQAYFSTVKRLATAKQFSLIEDILQHQKKYKNISDEDFVIRLIQLYGKAGMYEHAEKLFDEMPELKCERTVRSVNALLSAYVYSKRIDKISKLLEELPEKVGIETNLISYNLVIKAFCVMGSMHSALLVVDIMEKKGIEPNIITYNTLLYGFFSKGRIADGEELWGLMERKNIVPDIFSYYSKLKGLIYEKKMVEAVELLEEMKSKDVQPDVHSYNTLINGYCNDGNLEQVKHWYRKMKESCSPNRATYFTLIPFLCMKNEFAMAVELCKQAIDRHVIPRNALSLIDGLVQKSMVDEAIQLVELGNARFDLRLKLPLEARV